MVNAQEMRRVQKIIEGFTKPFSISTKFNISTWQCSTKCWTNVDSIVWRT
jgi:hypothetical protein